MLHPGMPPASSRRQRVHQAAPAGNRIVAAERVRQAAAGALEGAAASRVSERPSVALTLRFLSLCKGLGSQRVAIRLVILGHNKGVPGLPGVDDWTAWDADQMRAAVDYLERIRRAAESTGRTGP